MQKSVLWEMQNNTRSYAHSSLGVLNIRGIDNSTVADIREVCSRCHIADIVYSRVTALPSSASVHAGWSLGALRRRPATSIDAPKGFGRRSRPIVPNPSLSHNMYDTAEWMREARLFCALRDAWKACGWEWDWRWIEVDHYYRCVADGYLCLSRQFLPRRQHARESDIELHADDAATSIVPPPTDFLEWEYHVLFDLTWRVPVLYARAFLLDGRQLPISHLCDELDFFESGKPGTERISQELHPVLGTPFLVVHSCCVQDTLNALSQANNCCRPSLLLLRWFGVTAPMVGLRITPTQWSGLLEREAELVGNPGQ